KHMRGPQCSGILGGRKDLVGAARLNASPHSDALGRPLKVGREEMAGIWLAAEKYSRLDFAAIDRQCESQAKYLSGELKRIPGMKVSNAPHDRTRRVHRLLAEWDEKALRISRKECERQLMDGDPRIAILTHGEALVFTMFMNDPGDEKVVARRMREIFDAAGKRKG
ncbi:MAG: hypothetical protein ABIZ80_05165, partial [Bryobacteraceae bacterium]